MTRARKCKLCPTRRRPSNGIETTLGWFCYGCVKRFRRETLALDEKFDRDAKQRQAEVA